MNSAPLTVLLFSFSYKQDDPRMLLKEFGAEEHGGGFQFDCRCLPNPGRNPANAQKTGFDKAVQDELKVDRNVDEFFEDAKKITMLAVRRYIERQFRFLSIGFGCTGGQHRSVYLCQLLAAALRKEFATAPVTFVERHVGLTRLNLLPPNAP